MLAAGYVGEAVPMREARERVTGRLPFAANFSLPGLLHAKVLRSTAAHARIVGLDASRAEKAPGVVGVLSGADLCEPRISSHYGPVLPDRPVVAIDKVRYAGEPVAVVIAEDEEQAEEALRLVEVEYAELPAVFDPLEATQPEAPLIHDHVERREFLTFPDLVLNLEAGRNIFNHFKLRRGDVEAGFRDSDEVFEHTYRTAAQQHVSLEPHVAICQIEDGQVSLWSSASSPFTARFQLAETLRISQSRVQVVAWNIGGAFGGKTYPRIEPLAALATWKVGGRPVRLAFSRAEEFSTITRHAAIVTLKTGVRRDGTLVARQATVLWSAGAYADISPRVAKNGGYSAIGPYRVPNVWVDSYAVYTNVTPAGGFRGYGVPQVCWAYESQMDEIAHALGIDPLQLRRRNLARNGDLFSTGQVFEDTHFHDLLERCTAGMKARGTGVAVTVKTTVTPSTSTASLKLEEDGSLSLLVSTTEVGQGSRTVLAQIAADAVGVQLERVHQAYPDTALTPWDQTTSSSRSTMMMADAVRVAAEDIRRQLRQLAADLLEVGGADVELGEGVAWVRGVPESRLTFAEIVKRSRRGNLLASGTAASEGHLDPETGQGIATNRFFQAACAAEVSVDLATGQVTLERLNLQTYAGKVVNPVLAELQSEGNVAFGVGQALQEEIVLDAGQVQNATLADYMIPSLLDLPRDLQVGLLEDSGVIHGLGESGSPVVPAAIGNAVFDACGVRIRELPITPEKVLRAFKERSDGD
jgi:CO/xanthine dehydrogenase Mo-binding subunit